MEATIGIKDESLTKVGYILSKLLADEFVLYAKTRNAHWNVEGNDFSSKHIFFENQYKQVDEMMDSVAERIRTVGEYAPASLGQYLQLTHLTEQSRMRNDSAGFIRELLADHESIIIYLRQHIGEITEEFHDYGTSDFITGIMETHEKMAWMLRAHLTH
jgi:starvation-inducible DNA-binding protein